MRKSFWLIVILCCSGANLLAQNLTPHPGRRDQTTPGLVLDTGARTAACDAIMFTRDGQNLLAVGDDKVVRTWAVSPDGQLQPDRFPIIRWPIFRENRGNIYCLALSPDEKRVAFGGSGLTAGQFAVAVADRNSGRLLHGSDSPPGSNEVGAIWAISFSPSGQRLALGTDRGAVWIWDLTTEKFTKIGQFEDAADWGNTVRLAAFVDEGHVLTVCGNGELAQWSLATPLKKQLLHKFGSRIITPVVLSPDRQWIGVVLEAQPGASQTAVELVSFPDAKVKRQLLYFSRKTEHYHIPHRVAFNAESTRLAVGVRIVGNSEFDSSVKHFQERGGRVDLYDLTRENPTAQAGPSQSLYAEALAFHPQNLQWLAVAGGDDHDVVLWDVKDPSKPAKLGEVAQPGRCLWGVRISEDGKRISFQTQRHPAAPSPNERGQGDWKTFSLANLAFVDDPNQTVEPPKFQSNQWEVLTTTNEGRTTQLWRVRHKTTEKTLQIPLSISEDEFPRCYAFVPPKPGTNHELLLIGHYWGASLFQLDPDTPGDVAPRVRYLRGHEGYVTALAITPDGRKLVTASRDMTLAGWTLDDWPHHPRLGGELFVRGGKLVVGQLATGSPLWEMGLETGDELVSLHRADNRLGRVEVFNFDQRPPENAAAVRALLNQNLLPGREHVFTWRRPNNPTLYGAVTTLLDRPLWRFFPHNERDWVLWQWRDHYYAASTRGEDNVGWQASQNFASKRQPTFYKANQLQAEFRKPELVRKTLTSWTADQGLVEFNKLLPPRVDVLKLQEQAGQTMATIRVAPQGLAENQQARRFLVWLNDYLLVDEELPAAGAGGFQRLIAIPPEKLRTGPNLISAQCYARSGARGDATPWEFQHQPAVPPNRSLYGLMIGVNDYSRSVPRQVSLKAASDAAVLARALERQKTRQVFQNVQVNLLPGYDATRQSIFDGLRQLQAITKPDDLLVLYLGGHGTSKRKLRESKIPEPMLQGVGKYLFLLANTDVRRLPDTTISYEELQAELVKIPCHKLVLLDTCHSGEAQVTADDEDSNPIRILRQHGVGPVILAASAADQAAIESTALDIPNGGFGLFTIALRKILEDRPTFQQADTNRDNLLTATELIEGCKVQVKQLVASHNKLLQSLGEAGQEKQTPVEVLPKLEMAVVVAEK